MNYYEVLVSIKTETEGYKGAVKIKSVKETYLVDAMSVTEAEARVVKLFAQSGFSQDFEVIGVKGSKVIEVVNAEEPKKPKVTKGEDYEQEG
jgi:hypothetical protein